MDIYQYYCSNYDRSLTYEMAVLLKQLMRRHSKNADKPPQLKKVGETKSH